MIEAFLIGLAAVAVSVNLVYGTVLVWGLSGGDGDGSVPGGILALALFGSLIWSLIEVMTLLQPLYRFVVIGLLVVTAAVAMYVLQATEERQRRRLLAVSAAIVVFLMTLLVGVGEGGSVDGWRAVLVCLIPALLVAVAMVVVEGEADGDGLALPVVGTLALPAALLTLAVLV